MAVTGTTVDASAIVSLLGTFVGAIVGAVATPVAGAAVIAGSQVLAGALKTPPNGGGLSPPPSPYGANPYATVPKYYAKSASSSQQYFVTQAPQEVVQSTTGPSNLGTYKNALNGASDNGDGGGAQGSSTHVNANGSGYYDDNSYMEPSYAGTPVTQPTQGADPFTADESFADFVVD